MPDITPIANLFKPESLELTIVSFCIIILLIVVVILTRANTSRARTGNENNLAVTEAWMDFILKLMEVNDEDTEVDKKWTPPPP